MAFHRVSAWSLYFSFYVIIGSKQFNILGNHVPDSHCFADDSQQYISFKPDDLCG